MTLGDKLRKLRQEKGVTLQEASSDLGIAHSTLAGYEYGTREPSIEIINSLANFYKINVEDLIKQEVVPEYTWIDLEELLKREDITLNGKKLSKSDKNKIYEISIVIFA